MAVRGLRSRIDELSSALGSQEMPADQKQKLQEYQGEEAGAQQKIYELQADLKRGAEKIGETEKLAAKTEREAREKYSAGVRAEYARPDYDTMVAEFRPTKTQGSDIMGLFAMVSAVAFMSGGKGRYAGEAAMKNAGSMLEGWNKGREDLFKRELQEFDKNLKTVDQHNKASEAKLKKAIELFSVDRDSAMGLVAEIKAENVGTKAQQELNQGLLTQALNTLKEARAGSDKVRSNWNTIVQKAWEEQTKDNREAAKEAKEAGRVKEVLQGSDGNVYVVFNNGRAGKLSGEAVPEGVKLNKIGTLGKSGGASAAMERVMQQDIGNAVYNLQDIKAMGEKSGKLPGGSVAFANKFTGDIGSMVQRYIINQTIDEDLQGVDALMLNLAFDIASAQSGGRGQLSDTKVRSVVQQMPLSEQPEATKATKWAALLNRVEEANRSMPEEKQIKIREDVVKYFGAGRPSGAEVSKTYDDPEKERRYQEYKRSKGL